MKQVIRKNVFETNSSSTHTIAIGPAEDMNKWFQNKVYYNTCPQNGNPAFPTAKELRKIYENEGVEENFKTWLEYSDCYITIDKFSEDYETESLAYTTPGGEDIITFCAYGTDY